jgi:hypothetical protein
MLAEAVNKHIITETFRVVYTDGMMEPLPRRELLPNCLGVQRRPR